MQHKEKHHAGGAYRSMGAAWPQLLSTSADGHIAVVCPAGPEPLDSPDVGSQTE